MLTDQRHLRWQDELRRCIRLYDGFANAAPFVRAIYGCVDGFFEDHPMSVHLETDPGEAADRLRAGCPLGLNPALNTEHVVELLGRMSEALAEVNPDLRRTAKTFRQSLDHLPVDSAGGVTKEVVWGLCDLAVKEAQLEQDLATFLFAATLSSFYRQYIQQTSGVLRTDLWQGGNCPICAENPHYGLLRPEDGAKELECWLCETRWVYIRIKCPFCGNENQEELGYFTVENQEICRVSFCQRCHRYLKIVDGRKFDASGGVNLAIHNIASLSHDLLARQEGFAPGSGLEWVNRDEVTETRRTS